MKNIFLVTTLLLGSFTMAQKKTSKKKIVPPEILEPPVAEPLEERKDKCYIYPTQEKKDNMVYTKSSMLEYGGSYVRARMIITTSEYDASKKKEVEDSGRIFGHPSQIQIIQGTFTLDKNTVHFTPDKTDKYEKRTFQLVNKPKSTTPDYVKDEKNNIWKEGPCLEPMISL